MVAADLVMVLSLLAEQDGLEVVVAGRDPHESHQPAVLALQLRHRQPQRGQRVREDGGALLQYNNM